MKCLLDLIALCSPKIGIKDSKGQIIVLKISLIITARPYVFHYPHSIRGIT